MVAEANFLTGEAAYSFDLPDSADPQPELEAAITLGSLGRSLIYRPLARSKDPRASKQLRHKFDVHRRGHTVSVYEPTDVPRTLVAYWHLAGAHLLTFIDDDIGCGADLPEGITRIVELVDIGKGVAGLPRVTLDEPLRKSDPRDPFYRDQIRFESQDPDGDWTLVQIRQEPPWSAQGEVRKQSDDHAWVAVTNSMDIRVQVAGPRRYAAGLSDRANAISRSMVPH